MDWRCARQRLLLGIEFVTPNMKTMIPSDLAFTDTVVATAQEHGLLVYPSASGNGKDGAAIIIAPPLTIERAQIDELAELLERTFSYMEQHLPNEMKGNDRHDNDKSQK